MTCQGGVLVGFCAAAIGAADFDGNGRLDGQDVERFFSCMSSPDFPAFDQCSVYDLDGDADVDQSDFGILQAELTGLNMMDTLTGGTFIRDAEGSLVDGRRIAVFAPGMRRTRDELLCSAPNLTIFTGAEPGTMGRVEVHCTDGTYLYALDRAKGTLYRSQDGANWVEVSRGCNFFNYLFVTENGNLVTMHSTGATRYPLVSSDHGVTWVRGRWASDGTLMSEAPDERWSIGPWSLASHGHTLVMAFWNAINKKKQIMTSHDDGLTWTVRDILPAVAGTAVEIIAAGEGSVAVASGHDLAIGHRIDVYWAGGSRANMYVTEITARGSTFDVALKGGSGNNLPAVSTAVTLYKANHCHAVGYHAKLNKWVVNTGDGAGRRFLFVSDDDGDTWSNWQGTNDHPLDQSVRFRDFGHDTRLYYASDTYNGCGWVDLSTHQTGKLVDFWPENGSTFGWEIFRHDGLTYCCGKNSSGGLPGLRQGEIAVSDNLSRWARYCRIPSTYKGVDTFAGYFAGELHFMLEGDDGNRYHATLSPAKVRAVAGVVLQPSVVNLFPAVESGCERGSCFGCFGFDSPNLMEFTSDPADPDNVAMHLRIQDPVEASSRIWRSCATAPGSRYVATVRVKGTLPGRALWYAGTGNSGYAALSEDRWTTLRAVFTATAASTNLLLTLTPAGNLHPACDVWVDAIQLQSADEPEAEWVEGGGLPSTADALSFSQTLPNDFTLIVSAVIGPGSRTISGKGHLFTLKTTDGRSLSVFFDGSVKKWMLANNVLCTAAQEMPVWHNPDQIVRLALRHSAETCRLSVVHGDAVEHLAPIQGASLAGLATIVAGDPNGENMLPHTLLESFIWEYSMSDEDVEAALTSVKRPHD